MEKPKISWKRSLFTRMIFLFFLIMFPVFLLGFIIFEFNKQLLSEEVIKSTRAQASHYINSVDSNLQRISRLQSDFIRDTDILQISFLTEYMTAYDESRMVLRIHKRLTSLQNSSEYIKTTRVIIPSINRVINASGSLPGTYTYISQEEYGPIIILGIQSSTRILEIDDRLIMLLVYPSYSQTQRVPMFAIELELDKTVFLNEMIDIYNSEGIRFSLSIAENTSTIHNLSNQEEKNNNESYCSRATSLVDKAVVKPQRYFQRRFSILTLVKMT